MDNKLKSHSFRYKKPALLEEEDIYDYPNPLLFNGERVSVGSSEVPAVYSQMLETVEMVPGEGVEVEMGDQEEVQAIPVVELGSDIEGEEADGMEAANVDKEELEESEAQATKGSSEVPAVYSQMLETVEMVPGEGVEVEMGDQEEVQAIPVVELGSDVEGEEAHDKEAANVDEEELEESEAQATKESSGTPKDGTVTEITDSSIEEESGESSIEEGDGTSEEVAVDTLDLVETYMDENTGEERNMDDDTRVEASVGEKDIITSSMMSSTILSDDEVSPGQFMEISVTEFEDENELDSFRSPEGVGRSPEGVVRPATRGVVRSAEQDFVFKEDGNDSYGRTNDTDEVPVKLYLEDSLSAVRSGPDQVANSGGENSELSNEGPSD